MLYKFRDKILNLLTKYFLKRLYYRKVCLIRHSHILNFRKNYSNIKRINELDYKIFSQNGEDGIIDYFLHELKIEKQNILRLVLEIIVNVILDLYLKLIIQKD